MELGGVPQIYRYKVRSCDLKGLRRARQKLTLSVEGIDFQGGFRRGRDSKLLNARQKPMPF